MSLVRFRLWAPFAGTAQPLTACRLTDAGAPYAGIAHLVERHLAKVEVASSSLVTRSKRGKDDFAPFIEYIVCDKCILFLCGAIAKW